MRDPRAWILFGVFALIVATSARYRGLYHGNTIDDAYISFQYAKNWASGNGVVFNPGERVEGYTNFLWVALLAPLWPVVGHDAWRFAAAAWVLALTLGLLGIFGRQRRGRARLQTPALLGDRRAVARVRRCVHLLHGLRAGEPAAGLCS